MAIDCIAWLGVILGAPWPGVTVGAVAETLPGRGLEHRGEATQAH